MIKRISASMVRDYLMCPRLFYFRHYLKIKLPEKSDNLTFGSAVHEGLSQLYITNKLEKANEIFFEECKKENLSQKLIEEGLAMLNHYYQNKQSLEDSYGVKYKQSEQYARFIMKDPITNEELSLPFSLKIDLTSPSNKVFDFKTHSKKAKKEKDFEQVIQSFAYPYYYYQKTGKIPEFAYINIRKDKREITIDPYKRTIEDFHFFFKTVKNIIKKVENREFTRPFKGHFPYCECYKYDKYLLL